MHKLIYIIKILVIFLISSNSFSKTSSSYLIANTAMTLFDYEKANIHYYEKISQALDEILPYKSNE